MRDSTARPHGLSSLTTSFISHEHIMKLYATTRSERAEKGQGGNSYVATTYTIEHDTKEREVIATTSISREGDDYVVRHVPITGDETVHHVPIRKK